MPRIYQYKNTVFQTIQKNKRRLNAYILQSRIRRIKVYIMLSLIIFSNLSNVFAIENENIFYGDYQIYCNKDPYMYIKYDGKMRPNYEYYYIKDNVKYPAYCLNYGLKGAEEYSDGYTVDGEKKIEDEKLKMIILNGYPYKSNEELGLNTDEAIFATQFAIWCYLENMDINLVEPISDMNLNIVSKIKEIYNSKDNSIKEKDINLDITQAKQEIEKVNDTEYYYKIIKLAGKNVKDIEINTNDKNANVLKISDDEYKISIPVSCIEKDYNVKLDINLLAKENVVLFGKTDMNDFQNVAITLKDSFDAKVEKEILFEKYTSNIVVTKKDKETDETLSNVEFKLVDSSNNLIGNYTTDENGKAIIKLNNTDILNLKLKEVKAKEGYKLDDTEYEIKISPNESKNINIFNEKQKGKIEIVKKTKEYNNYTNLPENVPLENVKFEILDSNNNVVDTVITNEYGYAITKDLPIGKYYIKEIKTADYYKLLEDNVEVQIIDDGDVVNVCVLNENAHIEEKLPVTGK